MGEISLIGTMPLALSLVIVVLSAVLTKLFYSLAQNTRLMDKPNERSLHARPIVRGGGLVFIGLPLLILPIISYTSAFFLSELTILIVSITLLASVSFLDDLYQLSVKPRLLVQVLVALLVALFMTPDSLDFGLFSITNPIIIVPFLFLSVLWSINHFNFMDGIDGFCALQASFLFFSYAILFGFYSASMYQDFCLVLLFSVLGFLLFNFPPAKLFMGDVGSATLGLIVFCVALMAQQKYQIPLIYWFMLNALFLFDATVTLFRRILKKEKWLSPHRKHAYQRLKQLEVKTPFILLGQFIINASFLLLVLLVRQYQWSLVAVLGIQLCCMAYFYYLIEKRFPMFQ